MPRNDGFDDETHELVQHTTLTLEQLRESPIYVDPLVVQVAGGGDLSKLTAQLDRMCRGIGAEYGFVPPTPHVVAADGPGWRLLLHDEPVASGDDTAEEPLVQGIRVAIVRHLHELLDRDSVRELMDHAQRYKPMIVETVAHQQYSLASLNMVLCGLLRDRVPIRPLPVVLNAIAETQGAQSTTISMERVRRALARTITRRATAADGVFRYVRLADAVVDVVGASLGHSGDGRPVLRVPSHLARSLERDLARVLAEHADPEPVVVICPSTVRFWVARLLRRTWPDIVVLADEEIETAGERVELGSIGDDIVPINPMMGPPPHYGGVWPGHGYATDVEIISEARSGLEDVSSISW